MQRYELPWIMWVGEDMYYVEGRGLAFGEYSWNRANRRNREDILCYSPVNEWEVWFFVDKWVGE
jgi:hypothetical protein